MTFRRAAIVMRRLAVVGCTVGGSVGCARDAPPNASASGEPAATLAANATVTHVVDGDTIDVLIDGREERVRLIGIDTPEVAHAAVADRPATAGECFGDAASAFTTSLLPVGTAIRLERDVVGRDDYGRLLAYVHRADDGVFVNREIVRSGHAQPLTIAPNVAHSELFVEAARAAERADAGLWSACR